MYRNLQYLIDRIHQAMFTTLDESGHLRSRPMVTSRVTDDGYVWFMTWKDSPKIDEVRKSRQVNVSYADPASELYVSISGPVELVDDHDKVKSLWTEDLRAWFPKGYEDPDLLVMRVKIERAEYWDKKTSRLVPVERAA